MALGFLEMSLAENFCNGIPLGHTIERRRHVRRAAHRRRRCSTARSAHLDSALRGEQGHGRAQATFIQQASLILKARILDRPGQVRGGARRSCRRRRSVDVSVLVRDLAGARATSLGLWSIVNSTARLSVSDSVGDRQRRADADEERASVRVGERSARAGASLAARCRRQSSPKTVRRRMFVQLIWGRFDPIADGVGHRRAPDRSRGEAARRTTSPA